jgi:xanthine dehydrogenase YagR molybdenum-binding subunit
MTQAHVGKAIDRVDGRDKVLGKATYSAEWDLPGLLHAAMLTSSISRGRIAEIDVAAAEKAPGVKLVLTHHNARPFGIATLTSFVGKIAGGPVVPPDGALALSDDVIRYSGQPVAMVVADTRERALAAVDLVQVRYDVTAPAVSLEDGFADRYPPSSIFGEAPDKLRGDVALGLREADATVDVTYTTAAEAHNPMEPHATIADYKDGKLTLYDATQYVGGLKLLMAFQMGLLPGRVRVVSHYVGGAFGSKGLPWPHVPLTALAAMKLGVPVRFAMERRQMFGMVGFRPRTHQHLQLGAKRDGTLTAISHDGISQNSRMGEFTEPVGMLTRMLYACPNVAVTHRLVKLDTQTPTFQRAPGEAPGSLGLECAMDELAFALQMDPLAFRLKNYAERDFDKDRPWSSKELRECYLQGAERFGWSKRPLTPGSLKSGRLLVGWGCATASYPTNRSGAAARVRIESDGSALVQTASHDLGTGTYTVLTQVAADALGLPMERVRTELGDTDYPYAPVAGGSQSAASVSVPVHLAATEVRQAIAKLAFAQKDSPLFQHTEDDLGWGEGKLFVRTQPALSDTFGAILARADRLGLESTHETVPGKDEGAYGKHAWGAQFAEVHVDPDLGFVRVKRMVGVFAGGRILNLKTARSQLLGGMVMGIGMALLEEVVRDPRQGRVVNGSLADYLVPVHADIPEMDVQFVAERDDHVNPLGIKGLGELGIVGSGAAIANAVFHATGKRIRDLPITLEKLL